MAFIHLGVALLLIPVYFLYRLYQQRSLFKNLPGPPHHPLWGHLKVMANLARSLPRDADPQSYAHHIRRKYGLGDFFYLDLWPAAPPQLVIVHPDLAAQVAQGKVLFDKGDMVRQYLAPLVGPKAMVAANGHTWKTARRLFTPGLLHGNLLRHIPEMVQDTLIFREELMKHAEAGDLFKLEHLSARLIFNTATRIILGVNCNAIRQDHEFMTVFHRQAQLLPVEFWARYFVHPNPLVHFRRWQNRQKLDALIGDMIDERAKSLQGGTSDNTDKKSWVVVDHALDACMEDSANSHGGATVFRMDREMRDDLISQVKTLIFAGHDSSASTIAYTYFLLNRNPGALAKLRGELDEVFGKDVQDTAEILENDYAIINRLPFTLAVIKETLRMLPPIVGSYRYGRKGVSIYHNGKAWPTYPFACFINNHAMMRRPDIFKDPERFMPERYLVADPADPYYVPKDAWRGFEKGARNCIGDAMALIQIKVVLALTVRTFRFQEEYPEDAPEVDGEKMYATFHVTAKPALGMPGRVSLE